MQTKRKIRLLHYWIAVLLAAIAPLAAQTTLRQAAAARDSDRRGGIGGRVRPARPADESGLRRICSPANTHAGAGQRHEVGCDAAHRRPLTTSSRATSWWHSRRSNAMRVRGHNLCWHYAAPNVAGAVCGDRHDRRQMADAAAEPHQHRGDALRGTGIRVGRGERSFQRSRRRRPCGIPSGTTSRASGQTGTPGTSSRRSAGRTQPTPTRCCSITTTASRGRAPSSTPFYAMVQDFVNRGVPINGVGFEMHSELDGYPSASRPGAEHASAGGAWNPGAHH